MRQKLLSRLSQLDQSRYSWQTHWQELAEYILPEHGLGLSGSSASEVTSGGKVRDSIKDDTATFAVGVLAAGMHSGLTSPSRPWFRLGLDDRDLEKRHDIKVWLDQVAEEMRRAFARSAVYNALHHTYKELAVFGTGGMGLFEDGSRLFRARPYTVGEYWLALSDRLVVDTFYCVRWLTPRQMAMAYGKENLSLSVQGMLENNAQETLVSVVQAIDHVSSGIEVPGVSMPWRCVFFERGGTDDRVLKVSGYQEFPIMAPRWDVVSCKVYGSSRGMESLANIKMLQKMREKFLVMLDKSVDPPLRVPSSMKSVTINTRPNGVNYDDSVQGQNNFGTLYEVVPRLQETNATIQDVRQQIREGFFNDLFMMLQQSGTDRMTAREVVERHEEKLQVLGPVLERVHDELLDPLIHRAFNVMMRAGALPPSPESVKGRNLRPEYISVLAQAQRMVGLTAMREFAQFAGTLMSVRPEVADKLNFDAMMDSYADSVGVAPEVLVPQDEVEQLRMVRAQQQEAQRQAQAMLAAAQGAKTLSETDMGGNNALNAIMGRPQP